MKDASGSPDQGLIPPIKGLGHPALKESGFLITPPIPQKNLLGVQKLTSPIPEVSSSAPAPPPENSSAELKKLQAELDVCHATLEQWTRAEEEWTHQRRLFKVMTENVSDLILLVNRQGHRIWNNPAYSHAFGYTTEELAGMYAFSDVHPDDQARATTAFSNAMEQGAQQQVEFRVQQKDGSWVDLLTEIIPILNPDRTVEKAVVLARNITEQKKLTEALGLASTQVTAAGMAEGLAREFDQILTNVFGNLTIAKNLNGPHNAIAVRLSEIERALQRARDLTEQMLSISSSSDQPRERVALEPLLQEAVANVLRGTMVRAEYIFPKRLPELELDPDAFRHAIRSLVTNSLQAMDKGVIRFSAEYISQEQFGKRTDIPLKPGNYVSLHIQDQGHGMTDKVMARAFEPYFTTRQGAQGLGLSIALSTIQRIGGTIQLESTPSVGTIASIYLPAATALPHTTTLPTITGTTKASKKRILLMDDEQMILDIVSRMLDHLGYEVKTCLDGSQAIAAFTKAKTQLEPFDIVLMDLIIPNGVGGQDAVHTIRKIDPHAKVIASSGHLDHPVMVDYKKFGFSAALEKPYKLEKLQQLIEAVIHTPATHTQTIPTPSP